MSRSDVLADADRAGARTSRPRLAIVEGTTAYGEGRIPAAMGLPDGRTLTVRAIRPADVEGLDMLFGRLGEEERYHRFFQLSCPSRRFLEQMTRAEDEGGYRLAAVAPGSPESLAAEAGYAILPDGDGEFGLTVAPGWQGWRLGSRLLDALVAAAAARGVPNLQADILLDNRRMLALLSRRGYVTLGRDGFREARVAIAAAQPARRGPRGRGFPAA
jgi:GNAT superfamily N-acetyltransferase